MKLRLSSGDAPPRAPLVILFAVDGEIPVAPQALAGAVERARATGDVDADFRAQSLFHVELAQSGGGRAAAKRKRGKAAAGGAGGDFLRLGFVGLGKRKDLTLDRLRRAAAVAQKMAEDAKVDEAQLRLGQQDLGNLDAEAAGAAIAEGLLLGGYRYQPPAKKDPKPRRGQRFEVVHAGRAHAEFQQGFERGRIAGEAVCWVRDLANRPGNVVTPTAMAEAARSLQGEQIKVRVIDEPEMKRLRLGALLGVARGSAEPPKLIALDYRPPGARRTVCVVGKGLSFDTGGISIKPAAKMDEMRYDMCGAAAVLGLFHALRHGALRGAGRGATRGRRGARAQDGGPVRIVGVIAAAENMPDGRAQKPGDVVRAFDGTTIEVLNTDAEGRLVLADALAWAKKTYEPERIVDLATLTGAVVVALGHEVAGVLGNDQALVDGLIAAGRAADEPLWQLPLWDEHREQMKSKYADLQNINGPQYGGGTIAGAAFLSYFVEGTPWAHLDIAGTAWGGRAKDYYRSGATGTGVRTLLHWVRSL